MMPAKSEDYSDEAAALPAPELSPLPETHTSPFRISSNASSLTKQQDVSHTAAHGMYPAKS